LGGNVAFDARRPMLKQWIDVSGPSLVALRIRAALRAGVTAP
jgi:cell pole-organizing protein PopZ